MVQYVMQYITFVFKSSDITVHTWYVLFRVGGLVQGMAWDQHDERLAVLCQGKCEHILYASIW